MGSSREVDLPQNLSERFIRPDRQEPEATFATSFYVWGFVAVPPIVGSSNG
jgi:hypothetical protein